MFVPPKMLLPLFHLLQLHQLLAFSCFSIPDLLPFLSIFKNLPSIPDLTAMIDNCRN